MSDSFDLTPYLRVSMLPYLARCASMCVLKSVSEEVSFGVSAHTGTAVGRIIELWHRGGEDAEAFENARRRSCLEFLTEFPKADMNSAIQTAFFYAMDCRNQNQVVIDSLEREVTLHLEPDPSDPVQEVMEIPGHLDQIRRESDGALYIWDIKNGQPEGQELTLDYAWQLAGYALASTDLYGETVLPGGIIRTKGYVNNPADRCPTCNYKSRKKKDRAPHECDIFFETPWSLEACKNMMRQAARIIARLRRGEYDQTPGGYCNWCPGGGPHRCGVEMERL